MEYSSISRVSPVVRALIANTIIPMEVGRSGTPRVGLGSQGTSFPHVKIHISTDPGDSCLKLLCMIALDHEVYRAHSLR